MSSNSLPPIFQVIENFLELKNRDLSKLSFDELKQEWDKKINRYPYIFYPSSGSEESFHFFRARKINERIIIPLGALGYPESDQCERNRCNWKGYPVLYTSEFPATALFECQPRKGDVFYLSSWKINDLSKLRIAPFLYNYYGNSTVLQEAKKKILQDLKSVCISKGTSYEEEKTMMSLITDIFQDSDHCISSFLSHFYLYEYPYENENHKKPNTIIYPSIRTNKHQVNYAFHPDLVEQGFICQDHIVECIITDVGANDINFQLVFALGTVTQSGLIWKEISQDDLKRTEFKTLVEALTA